jgi:hypothetical protein
MMLVDKKAKLLVMQQHKSYYLQTCWAAKWECTGLRKKGPLPVLLVAIATYVQAMKPRIKQQLVFFQTLCTLFYAINVMLSSRG